MCWKCIALLQRLIEEYLLGKQFDQLQIRGLMHVLHAKHYFTLDEKLIRSMFTMVVFVVEIICIRELV